MSFDAAIRLLVVDDESDICEFLRSFFDRRGFEVRTAASGEEALQAATDFRPRVILLDVKMPGLSGIDVLPQLHQEHPECRIVMITALDDVALMDRARALGAVDYIRKPFSLDYLGQEVLVKLNPANC